MEIKDRASKSTHALLVVFVLRVPRRDVFFHTHTHTQIVGAFCFLTNEKSADFGDFLCRTLRPKVAGDELRYVMCAARVKNRASERASALL